MLNLVKELCALPGVSSFEEPVRAFIRERVAPHADEIRVDALGNLIVFKKGAKPGNKRLLVCAHMDEVGLMVRQITDEGYLKFGAVGGIDRRVLLGKRVLVSRPTTWFPRRRRRASPSWRTSTWTSAPEAKRRPRPWFPWGTAPSLTATPWSLAQGCSRQRRWTTGWAAPL